MGKITFDPDGNGPVAFYVLEQTRLGGVDYLLVTDAEEGDGDAMILKDLSSEQETEALYEFVESDEELEAVAQVFSNILDDIDLK